MESGRASDVRVMEMFRVLESMAIEEGETYSYLAQATTDYAAWMLDDNHPLPETIKQFLVRLRRAVESPPSPPVGTIPFAEFVLAELERMVDIMEGINNASDSHLRHCGAP